MLTHNSQGEGWWKEIESGKIFDGENVYMGDKICYLLCTRHGVNSFHNHIDPLRPRYSLVFSLFVNESSTVPEASKSEAIEAVAIEIVVKTR